eukprot:TRINITY_DN22332_c0_g2_i1.p1 TRINITY_DN22332_c0_g2~~TRINITY_DN22332_c0_g2_i1.p1  ORF type:complete len:465 (+),score=64.07 TRINITY_DN22332_c0_g2_i1:81-1475(+)
MAPESQGRDAAQPLSSVEFSDGSPRNVDRPSFLRKMLATMGPGLMVCFADTDGSCLLTAADSGSKWRYKLLLLQIILIPTLYFAQELAVRCALCKGKGMTALLRQEAGASWAWAVAVPLLADACLALISEISVFGQTVRVCWGVQPYVTNTLLTLSLIALALTGSYSIAEKVGLAMGVLQVFFFLTMFMAKPSGSEVWNDLWSFPFNEGDYVKLVTANIGAVIMPWMLAYQQSALCEKGVASEHDSDHQLDSEHLLIERIDTAVGSFLTQGVMAAMLITVAASPKFSGENIDDVDQLLTIFADVMGGELRAKILLTFAVCGACMVAAIVVSLCGAWALEEALGREMVRPEGTVGTGVLNRVRENLRSRSAFYTAFTATCSLAWLLTIAAPNFTNELTGVWTQFVNGLLMPPVIFALWYLSAYKLPEEHRLGRSYKWFLFLVFGICSAFCLASIPIAIQDALNGN